MEQLQITRQGTASPEQPAEADPMPLSTRTRGDPFLHVYRIIADYLVTRRQHRTCASLNATNKAIFRTTLPILFRTITLQYDWTASSTLTGWVGQVLGPLKRARGARYIQ